MPTCGIQQTVAQAAKDADDAIERLAIHEAIAAIWTIVDELNGYITEQEPWVLAKDPANADRLSTVLYTASEGLRALAVLLSPVTPKATAKLWTALGAEANLGADHRAADSLRGRLGHAAPRQHDRARSSRCSRASRPRPRSKWWPAKR